MLQGGLPTRSEKWPSAVRIALKECDSTFKLLE